MNRPTKLSSKVFLELPPVLAHYLESERNMWLDSNPNKGKLTLMNRLGAFLDLETLEVERRQQVQILGHERARALAFRTGFEQGRRDGARHFEMFGQNVRLALQAGPVFAQLQGRYVAEQLNFEFDLDGGTLWRELLLHSSVEAIIQRMAFGDSVASACWNTAGYLSGHVSEILGRRVITLETECVARGDKACRLITRLDTEWDGQADMWREALRMPSLDAAFSERDALVTKAQTVARKAQRSLVELSRKLHSPDVTTQVVLIADSPAMEPSMQRARLLQQAEVPVLLCGERGSGRETLARYIHRDSDRGTGPFVVLEPAGLTEKLLQQELMGFVKGAFPGAFTDHKGTLQRAHRGTLFISDLAAIPIEVQRSLCQIVQSAQVTPIGADKAIKCEVRLIAALDDDPEKLFAAKVISEELYYAVAMTRIDIPPLRQREGDVIRLADHFVREFAERYERDPLTLSDEVLEVIQQCTWPGNVRQLRSVIEHAAAMTQDSTLRLASLPEEILLDSGALDAAAVTVEVIQTALKKSKGNKSEAAKRLGIGRTTLWRHMKRHELE
jgi:DNA-binding NtrC family response regulator/predicted hydrocarbon binding protein